MQSRKWSVAFALLLVILLAPLAWAASEHILFGSPERVYYGDLKLGNGSISPTTATKYHGHMTLEPAGNSTYGQIDLQSRTAGAALRTTTIHGSILATGNTDYAWFSAYPAASGYLATVSTAGVLSYTDPATVGTNYWQRTGTLLEPATANDIVAVTSNTTGVGIASNVSGNGGYCFYGTNSGLSGDAVVGEATSQAGIGVVGIHNNAAGASYGVWGGTNSSDNAAYSIFANDQTYLGDYADATELGGAPADPDAGWRAYYLADGLHVVNAAGTDVGPLIDAAAGGAPSTAQYVTSQAEAGLSNEDVATQGTGITITGAGTGTLTFAASPTPGMTSIASGAFPAGASVSITNIPATYSSLVLQIAGASCSAATQQLLVRLDSDNGASYDATAGNYVGQKVTGTTWAAYSTGALGSVTDSVTQTAAQTCSATIHIVGYNGGMYPRWDSRVVAATTTEYQNFGTYIGTTFAINAIMILWTGVGSNFDAGTYALFGIS